MRGGGQRAGGGTVHGRARAKSGAMWGRPPGMGGDGARGRNGTDAAGSPHVKRRPRQHPPIEAQASA